MAHNTEQELSEKYQKIGRILSESMGDGIAEGGESAHSAMDMLTGELLDTQIDYFREKTKLEQAISGATEAQYKSEYQKKLIRAKTTVQLEKIQQAEISRLQKKSSKEYVKALKAQLQVIEAQIKLQKSRIVNEFSQIAQSAVDSLGDIEKATAKMEEKMAEYGGMFKHKREIFLNTGPGGTPEVFERAVLDLSDKRQELEQYAAMLQKLSGAADIPTELFQAIRDLSVEDALKYQKALLALPDDKRAAYIADWEAIQKLSEETAQKSYVEDTKKALSAIEAELEAWYGTIPEGFFYEGELSAEQFGTGFINKLAKMQGVLQEAVASVLSVSAESAPSAAAGEASNIQNTHNNTYVLKDSGTTIAQQLQAIAATEAVKRLRGM